jgi:outer membrane immunogenic protein
MIMRKAAVSAAAAVITLIATQVMAADIAAKAPLPMPPAVPPLNWTGCNLNVGFGYGLWNQTQHTELGGVQESVDITSGGRGWLGRLGGGCDLQIPGALSNWVVGAFADYDFMSLKGSNTLQNNVGAGVGIPLPVTRKRVGHGMSARASVIWSRQIC